MLQFTLTSFIMLGNGHVRRLHMDSYIKSIVLSSPLFYTCSTDSLFVCVCVHCFGYLCAYPVANIDKKEEIELPRFYDVPGNDEVKHNDLFTYSWLRTMWFRRFLFRCFLVVVVFFFAILWLTFTSNAFLKENMQGKRWELRKIGSKKGIWTKIAK